MYRIVHNAQTDSYRIEKRGFLGWNFVPDRATGDYLQFDDLEAACRWVTKASRRGAEAPRRWRVVSACSA